ncbi:hypothetical protein BHM03_00038939 [Ensete ventricosum]|uniref:Uncharacterized protein n=1 Tax=Ensete ventricosum TaxID=4639 RepID=A0A445MKE8_ENSVE|nr:hypothetical protein BHM03_00038939 [Ensete ventricosum]
MQKEDGRVLKTGREVEDDQLYGPWVLVQRKTRRRVAKPNRIACGLDHIAEGDPGQGGTKPHWNGLNKLSSSKGVFGVNANGKGSETRTDSTVHPIEEVIVSGKDRDGLGLCSCA